VAAEGEKVGLEVIGDLEGTTVVGIGVAGDFVFVTGAGGKGERDRVRVLLA
jgi:hypothetical protein